MDLVLREMEEMEIKLEKFIRRSHRQKCNFKAELEEIGIRIGEVKEAKEIFEQVVVVEGVDQLTQRIPAEKFIRYMEEWLKSAEFTLGKMRLRTSTLRHQYIKLKNQLVLKEELGETVHAVDFDKLQIENQHLLHKIDQKNNHLIELKKMNGRANLVLSTQKKYLQQQVKELNDLKEKLKSIENRILELDSEAELADREASEAQEKHEHFIDLRYNYRVPEIIEYIRKKAELGELKKNVKILVRKNNINRFSISSYTRKMQNLTGIKRPRPSWYKLEESFSKEFDVGINLPSGSSSNKSGEEN